MFTIILSLVIPSTLSYGGPVYGIWFENSTDETYTANVYYNTIYVNSTGGKATGTQVSAIGRVGSLVHVTITMKDNILYNDNNTATSFAANFPGSGGVEGPLVSDYNDIYVSGLEQWEFIMPPPVLIWRHGEQQAQAT
jgi:hypothetical protein